MNKLFIFLTIGLCYCTIIKAQVPAKHRHLQALLNNAEKEYRDLRYSYAIPYYQAYLHTRPDDSIANLHLAAAFRLVKQFDSALLYYGRFLTHYKQTEATGAFAELAASLRQYQLAVSTYKQLSLPGAYGKLVNERIRGFEHPEQFQHDSLDYTLHYLKLNTSQDEYSPQYFHNGLVFVSNRYYRAHVANEFGWDGFPYAGVYQVSDMAELYTINPPVAYHKAFNQAIRVNDDYTPATSNDNNIITVNNAPGNYTGSLNRLAKLSDDWKGAYNYGPLCFTADGKKVYFTRNAVNRFAGRSSLEICEATYENGSWKQLHLMPFTDPAYDFYHPALSADGSRLYFCSNKPGGFGGSDLYYVSLTGDLKQATNLGSQVNTAGNELFPTISGDTLYFSSDGHAGLGGLDLYKTVENASGGWLQPVNMGYPLNSSYDDFGIIFSANRKQGFFTSNRLGSDDIFSFDKQPVFTELAGNVLSAADKRRLPGVQVVSMRSHQPIDSITTDITGNFVFAVKPTYDYTLLFSKVGYAPDSLTIHPNGARGVVEISSIFLRPARSADVLLKAPEPVVQTLAEKEAASRKENLHSRLAALAQNVYFKTASAVIAPASLQPLNEIIGILKDYPGVTLTIEGHTDNRGGIVMNKKLSQQRADAIRDYFVAHGLDKNKLKTAGYGPDRPIADNASAAGRAKNRRVVMTAALQ